MNLKEYRKNIDTIDSKVIALLNDRARMSMAIGEMKRKVNKGFYAPAREQEILKRLVQLNKGPMTTEAFESIYREIMSSSLSLEKDLQIACLGTEGSFTWSAANKIFGSQLEYVPCPSIFEVFQKVEDDDCDYGVVPVENSVEGAVTYTYDELVDSDLRIVKQRLMPIEHNLMSKFSLNKIKYLYSNPQVFGQCRHWLQNHLPDVGLIPADSTTSAAQQAATTKNAAAIASKDAAKIYRLKILRSNIQDIKHNTTRFLVIGKDEVPPTGKDRTSILFSIKDKVGALHAMLSPFYRNKINLTKIESRPSKKKAWDYYFFVDFEGHHQDKHVKKALAQLEDMCKYLKVLGSYPA